MSSIILVDDERILNETLKDLIELMGFRVESFYSLKTALASKELDHADMIICDVGLPGEDVFEQLRLFKLKRQIPFILLSAFSSPEYLDKAQIAGADRYLVKPASIAILKQVFDDFIAVDDERKNSDC